MISKKKKFYDTGLERNGQYLKLFLKKVLKTGKNIARLSYSKARTIHVHYMRFVLLF